MPYVTQSSDTSRDIEDRLFAAYRRMSAAEKLERVGRLGAMVKAVVMADLRARYPAADDRELALRYAVRSVGPELLRSAFGWSSDAGS
jgi:hypothetical protein